MCSLGFLCLFVLLLFFVLFCFVFCFLRCSEFTVKFLKDPVDFLKFRNVEYCQDKFMFTLFLVASRPDPFRRGTRVLCFRNESLCPVSCMQSYLENFRRELFQACSCFSLLRHRPFCVTIIGLFRLTLLSLGLSYRQ